MRIAEARGLPFSAEAADGTWLHVVIGVAPLAAPAPPAGPW